MRRPCSILSCVLVAFGVSLFVPEKAVPETTYDESETLPYVSTSVVSVLRPEGAVPVVATLSATVQPGGGPP